jgi:hypothetical protein
MEAYIVHLAEGLRIFGQGYAYGNFPQLFLPLSGISEVRTADSYGTSEFMLKLIAKR